MKQSSFDPRLNQLLAMLPAPLLARWMRRLEVVRLPASQVLCDAGQTITHAFFPTTAVVSLSNMTQSGQTTQLAMVGSEGFVGVEILLGGQSMLNVAFIQTAGEGCRLEVPFLKQELSADGPALHLLLRYTQALITQMAQTAVCNRHHSVEQQLCRWLLLSLDRHHGNELHQTHESIASALGVRREGVTESAGKLQKERLIHYGRGSIVVVNRAGIEQRVCECYRVVKREYERLLPHRPAD